MYKNFMNNFHQMAIKNNHDSASNIATNRTARSGFRAHHNHSKRASHTRSTSDETTHTLSYSHPQSDMQIAVEKAAKIGFLKNVGKRMK